MLSYTLKKYLGSFLARHDANNDFLHYYTSRVRKYKKDFFHQPDKIADFIRIIDMLDDEASKESFEREVYFLQASYLFAAEYISPCTALMWERALNRASALLKENKVPQITLPDEETPEFIIATNFVMKQYEYAPYVRVEPEDIFIDCGAYVGDTAMWAMHHKAAEVHSFEPNAKNFELLNKNIEMFDAKTKNIHTYQLGLSNTNGQVAFSERSAASKIVSNINRHANASIEVVSLDSWCQEHQIRPTYIKMDIEGAEFDALCGAEQVIRQYKPKLAICLYHKAEHMLQIPEKIKELCPDYRLWCKKAHPQLEFVLFASV